MAKRLAFGALVGAFFATAAAAQPAPDRAAALEALVLVDARGWMLNRYDVGSMRNVQLAERSADGRLVVVRGEYTFNKGRPGWVRVRFEDNKFQCIEFWDFRGQCRPLGQSPSQGIVAAVIAGAIASDGGSSASEPQRQPRYPHHDPSTARQPEPPPQPRTPPIGPLYGCSSPPCW